MAALIDVGLHKYSHKNSQIIKCAGSGDGLTSTIDVLTRHWSLPWSTEQGYHRLSGAWELGMRLATS